MPRNREIIDPKYNPFKIAGSFSKLHVAAGTGNFRAVHAAIRSGADINQHVPGIGITPLFCAIIAKNLRMVEELVCAGADVNAKATDQMTPLCIAVNTGKVEIVRFLLDNGADISARIVEYDSALHVAAQGGYADVAAFLIDRGLDVNVRNRQDETALHTAVKLSEKEVVGALLRKGIDVNATSCSKCDTGFGEVEMGSNVTAVFLASIMGHLEIVDMLIKAGADVNARSSGRQTALHAAAMEGPLELLNMLLKAGADVNAQTNLGRTPLYLAVMKGHTKIVAKLLSVEEIDVDTITDDRKTPLLLAVLNGHLEIVKLLIAKGAPINGTIPNPPFGSVSPLDAALMERKENVAEYLIQNGADIHAKNTLVHMSALGTACGVFGFSPKLGKLLIEKGADINEKSYDGSNLVHFAAQADGDPVESVQFLIESGANPELQNLKKWTPLHYAIDEGNVKIADYLVTKIKEIDPVTHCFQTPLHFAVDRGQHEVVKILLKYGANANAQDMNKRTPLHIAAAAGQLETVKLLLKHKAAVNLKDNTDECTALFSATKNGDEKLVSLLLDSDADPNVTNKSGIMPIHVASNVGNVAVVKALLEKGAYFDVTPWSEVFNKLPLQSAHKGGNAKIATLYELIEKLFDAVIKNNIQEMSCCIQAGAIVNARNVSGRTALHFAVSNCNIDALSTLLANGADIGLASSASFTGFRYASNIGNTPLHIAVTNKSREMVEILLAHAKKLTFTKVNLIINAKTTEGATALHLATVNNSLDIVKLLIQNGTVYNAKNKLGKTPLELSTSEEIKILLDSVGKLFQAVEKDSLEEVVRILKNNKSVVNARDLDGGGTPLYWAVSKGRMEIANFLLTNDADYCLVTDKGTTPLHIAASKSNVEIVETLVTRMKNDNPDKVNNFINAQTESGTVALHVASSIDVVKCLLQAGAIYNIRNKGNKTPLKTTQKSDIRQLLKTTQELFRDGEKGVSSVISMLNSLEIGEFKAVANARDEQGQTLSAVAIAKGHVKIASKLLEKLKKLS